MKKLAVPLVIGALVFACLVLADRSCQQSGEIEAWKAENSAIRAANAEAEAASRAAIADLDRDNASLTARAEAADTVIRSKDAALDALRGRVNEALAVSETLRTEVQPVLDANPKVAELVASLDSTITLQSALINDQQSLILTLKDRVALGDARAENKAAIAAEWKGMYEREAALRANLEQGLGLYQKQARASRVWKVVAKVGPPVAFVVGFIAGK